MRRYQLSGLEHVHMMRHVPRSYDMTRTHIMHKAVNKHVDVVLRCSPKNWKKKKVTVSVVRGEKKTDAARIRANAKKGYVAVRKVINDKFEADRRAAAAAYETKYGTRSAGSDALIHDMKSQISAMAKKSADYIDDQLTAKPVVSYAESVAPAAENKPAASEQPILSAETEDILKKGGYRLPNSRPSDSNPYAADYIMHASNEEFHILMDSLEKSLDEACKKYAVEPVEPEIKTETEDESETETGYTGYTGYSDYKGGYNLPSDISLSVNQKQEIKAEQKTETDDDDYGEEFKPALTFTDGGEHYIPEDGLFDRELNRLGESYVPPAYFFDDDDTAPSGDVDDSGEAFVPLPDPEPLPVRQAAQPQNIFYTEENDQPVGQSDGYPREDYTQQQVFFPTQPDDNTSGQLYNPPQEEEEYADPTLYHDTSDTHDSSDDYEPPMVFPYEDEGSEPPALLPDSDDDVDPPMIFPDDGEEDIPPPMIFPDDEEEGYSPAPVSPDRNEYYDDGSMNQGVMNRSGQTLFSRTGDQIRKVIGIIRGSSDADVYAKKNHAGMENRNVEITYSDRDNQ